MYGILIAVVLPTLFYYYGIRPLFFWRKQGVKQNGFPKVLFENYFGLLNRTPSIEVVKQKYKMFPGTRYHGGYLFHQPSLIIKDIDLLKQMLIKDFQHFNEHVTLIDENADPMWANNLFSLKGLKWRQMRTALSPCFTSSRIKWMFGLIQEIADRLVKYLQNQESDMIHIEARSLFSKYCTDVIASTAFGIEVDSLNEPTNDFFINGNKLLSFANPKTYLKLIFGLFCPQIAKIFKIKFIHHDSEDFFKKIVKDSIKMREKSNLVRRDMIQLLVDARKGKSRVENQQNVSETGFASAKEHLEGKRDIFITNDDILAQCLVFFFAGFDSSSTLMSFLAYELCINQDIQDKLRQEIEETYEKCNEGLTYEALVNMKYMDMVVTELLRKWPAQPSMDRICTKPYVIQPTLPGETPVHIPIGTNIGIPISGFHHDPKYFPNPEKFDPERFSEENKRNVNANVFLAFGMGPRNCIGSRFALLETKILFFYILKHFKIVPTDKTDIPIKLLKSLLVITAEDGFNMGLQRFD